MRTLLASILLLALPGALPAQKTKTEVFARIDAGRAVYDDIALKIWDFAEVGYREHRSSALLQERLRQEGFAVEAGVAGIPTAFIASAGSGAPVIGVLAEFDALPGASQEAVPEKKPRPGASAGHACGHHLFGAGSVQAAVAIKEWLRASGRSGTVRLYGTPAEEGGSGKVYLVRAGLFRDVDVALHWHPADRNTIIMTPSLANRSGRVPLQGSFLARLQRTRPRPLGPRWRRGHEPHGQSPAGAHSRDLAHPLCDHPGR